MQDDLYIISQVLSGKTTAYAQLVERYQDYVFTIAHRVLPKREDAEEAAQDTFVKAYKMLATWQQASKFSTWLYKIASNTAIDYSRRKSHITDSIDRGDAYHTLPDHGSLDTLEQMKQHERQQAIENAIQSLPGQDGLIITLFYLQEKSIDEVAEITGLSQSNVKVKLMRIRAKLKEKLSNL